MNVIGASFGRTGTSSVRVALEMLGFGPCHTMKALFDDAEHARQWLRVADGARPDWEALLGGFGSSVAWPAAYFWRELTVAYPTAKVLLIVRDPDSWYASMTRTLYRTRPTNGWRVVADELIERIVWQGTFDGRFDDRDHAVRVYRAHLDEVRATVPTDRLVEVDVDKGWEPLCAGLGVPVPRAEFPCVNTTDEYVERARRAGVLPASLGGES